ncbi:MAG: divergent polysaccharide deacetylase family protein [Atribacterota bacterium]|jgi:polysaccharide deacetylase 2 family uncharacterized protein YibQ|nr:divergent polysaccharide deacetylase family protein [Atribacterota bacterium]MDD5496829.1 divergent polysaccharide deacetylase family protein [Atribacterota bacterium]
MSQKFWNYGYSVLLSIILLLLIGIFINWNDNKSENYTLGNNKSGEESLLVRDKQLVEKEKTIFLYDLIDQKDKELQLFNRFVEERKKEEGKAKVAIIIDDMGYQKEMADRIMNLNFPVTVSVLPFLPYSRYVAQLAKEKGMTVLLHLPMEPHNSNVDPGKGAIFSTMSEQEIRAKFLANWQDVPYVSGVSNHMGSKITENRDIMKIILSEIKEKNLYFIDSMTSPDSVGYQLSREMGIKTAQRTVFLDNEQDIDYIGNQIDVLKEFALKYGSAIAIGHPYCNTIDMLMEAYLTFPAEGIEIVKLEELLE